MFGLKRRGTIIGNGLKVVGNVTAEGLVEVYGEIEGDLHCTSLMLARKAHVTGAVTAERVTVNGTIDGPIHAKQVVLKSRAHVVGDIHHHSLSIQRGAYFEGRSVQAGKAKELQPEKVWKKPLRPVASANREAVAAAGAAH